MLSDNATRILTGGDYRRVVENQKGGSFVKWGGAPISLALLMKWSLSGDW